MCMHMKMSVRMGMGSGVRVVGWKGRAFDTMCPGGPGKGAHLDFLPHVDLGREAIGVVG